MKPRAFQIRRAELSEFAEVAAFARKTFVDAFGIDMGEQAVADHLSAKMRDGQFAEMLQDDSFYLAESNQQLLGFVQVGRVDAGYGYHVEGFDSGAAEIRRLYVLAECQRAGIGKALLEQAMIDHFVESADVTYLTTWESNERARKLYRKHGFKKIGQIPEYSSDGALNGHEHVMERRRADLGLP